MLPGKHSRRPRAQQRRRPPSCARGRAASDAAAVDRARGETQLFVKEVKLGTARYILCRNEAKAEPERNVRQAIVAGLSKQLARGDKALIGNSAAYPRYLRPAPSGDGKCGPASRSIPAN